MDKLSDISKKQCDIEVDILSLRLDNSYIIYFDNSKRKNISYNLHQIFTSFFIEYIKVHIHKTGQARRWQEG